MPSQFDSYKGPILEEDENELIEPPPMKPRLGKGLSMLLHTSVSSTQHSAK